VAVETRVVAPAVPGDLLTCEVPAPQQIAMDSDVADYLAHLYAAASACAQKLKAVSEIVMPPNSHIER